MSMSGVFNDWNLCLRNVPGVEYVEWGRFLQ